MAVNNNYQNGNDGKNDNSELYSWIPVIVMLLVFWPVGLFLLFRKLMGYSGASSEQGQQQRHPYDAAQERRRAAGAGPYAPSGSPQANANPQGRGYQYRYGTAQEQARQQPPPTYQQSASTYQPSKAGKKGQEPGMQGVYGQERDKKGRYMPRRKPVDLNKGKGMMVWGFILAAIFALSSLSILPEVFYGGWGTLFGALFPCLGFMSGGLVMAYAGHQRNKKAKRFRKYLALIGRRESISIASLAQAMPVSVRTACDDLQEMLDEGMIPRGYLDMGSGRLVLSDAGLQEEPEAQPEPEPEEKPQDDDAILAQIRTVNDAIADPEMSRKIDRIGEITGKILNYQKQNPAKAGQLRSFLNYYLPTTLKILNAYAQMEAQGIEGENINHAKSRIEGMMDKVVEGFEKQLDKLFADSAMDITTDVEVLERMLDKDGLSGSEGMTLGG